MKVAILLFGCVHAVARSSNTRGDVADMRRFSSSCNGRNVRESRLRIQHLAGTWWEDESAVPNIGIGMVGHKSLNHSTPGQPGSLAPIKMNVRLMTEPSFYN